MNAAQDTNDVVAAQEILQDTFRTDVRAIAAEARVRSGGALDPLQFYRDEKIRKQLTKERGTKNIATGFVMAKTPVILIFDVGKTNKKVLLFNEQYRLVFEESKKFEEIKDEDGFPCEDVSALTEWVKDSFDRLTPK